MRVLPLIYSFQIEFVIQRVICISYKKKKIVIFFNKMCNVFLFVQMLERQ